MRMSTYGALSAAALAVLTFSATPSKADTYAYEEATPSGFGTIDLTTGVYSPINGIPGLTGLGNYAGKLYGGQLSSQTLYSINPSTGLATAIGTGSIGCGGTPYSCGYEDTGSTPSGLYGLGRDGNLYRINPATGATTLIGATGIPIAGVIGMSANGGALFVNQDNNLYRINTTTGLGTLVGSLGATFGAMVDIGGVWYGGAYGYPGQVYTFNPLTAATTAGATVSPAIGGEFWGLAPSPIPTGIPEPATWAIMLLGFAGLGVAGRLGSRRRPALG